MYVLRFDSFYIIVSYKIYWPEQLSFLTFGQYNTEVMNATGFEVTDAQEEGVKLGVSFHKFPSLAVERGTILAFLGL